MQNTQSKIAGIRPNGQAALKKQKQFEAQAQIIREQDRHNKHNLEIQHKFNLEIFEKQANLTERIATKTAIYAIIASIIGAIVGGLIVFWLNTNQQQPQKQSRIKSQTQQNQDSLSTTKEQELSYKTKKQKSEQEALALNNGKDSSTNVSSKNLP